MVGWFYQAGIYLLILGLLLAGAFVLVLWGLFGDRSKGRARCPKCLYDMRGRRPGLSGLVCPECGHDARAERHLYKDYRRWRLVALGLLLMFLSASPPIIVNSIVYGWHQEQAVIKALDADEVGGGISRYSPILPPRITRHLPGPLPDYCERVYAVQPQTEAGFVLCARFKHLWWLDMRQLPIRESDLARIKRLKNLGVIQFERTQLRDTQAVELKRALPHCEIRLYHEGNYQLIDLPKRHP